MSVSVNEFEFALESLFGNDTQYKLLKVKPWRDYDSSDKKQVGYKYQVLELERGIRLDVKVTGDIPAIKNEDLLKAAAPVFVTFVGSRASFYGDSLWKCDITVQADRCVIKAKT